MNQILVATIIAVSIIGTGAYAASQVSEMSAASSMSSDIDIEKKSENMNVFFNGSINIINTGKNPSEIAMFRFYNSSGIEVHRVMIPDGTGRTFGAHSQVVGDNTLTSVDAHLPRHTTQSFSLDDMGIDSLEGITGELVTQRGRTFPISFDERTNQNGVGTGDGIIEAAEKFLDELKTNQNDDGTDDDTIEAIEAVEEFLDELKTNQNGVGTGYDTIEAIEEFLDELKTNQNDDGTDDDTIEAIEAVEEFLEKLKTNQNGDGTGVGPGDGPAPTQIKQVPEKSSTSSDSVMNGIASTSSNISTSTFLTATHDGMMSVDFDLKVGGGADYATYFTYREGVGTHETCGIFRDRAGYGHTGCITNPIFHRENSIINIASLLSTHEEELVQSLNNGQVSKITVEVDIFRNTEHVDTKLIYEVSSAQAGISTTQSETYDRANSQVHITYPLDSFSDDIDIPVNVGDMMEFVVRVNLSASDIPTQSDIPTPSPYIRPAERPGQQHTITSSMMITPMDSNESYSSYVQVKTEFGGGVITVEMS